MLFHQSQWQVLLQCAGPRCHHMLRTVPPRQCAGFARGHDLGKQRVPGNSAEVEMAQHITTLPMRMGGLGLRSAMRTAKGAYWASWADALHMLQQRLPQLTGLVVHHLSHPNAPGCFGELESASQLGSSLVPVGRCCDEASDLDPPDCGARRVASWLAVLFVFQFRTPISGDGSACPVVCCRPGPSWCCMGPPLRQSWFWRGCACPFPSPRRGACVGVLWIVADNTMQRAHVLAFCVRGHHCPERSDSMRPHPSECRCCQWSSFGRGPPPKRR